MTVGIVILTLNAAKDLPRLLPLVIAERPDRIVVFDSMSTDGTIEWVREQPGVELCLIERGDFNHGATREYARNYLATDIAVMLTQDVIPIPGWLNALVAPICQGNAVVAYARQLPHEGADIFEAFPREFNYPAVSQRRTLADAKVHGVYTFFCSDSCSAYLNKALDDIGGFETTLTNEDYFATARLLHAGGAIYYAADARVRHSHRYTLRQEFSRNFDNGYVRAENWWVTQIVGGAEGRGSKLTAGLIARLAKSRPWLVPYAILQAAMKWLGYRTGFFSYHLSGRWCRSLSTQKYYWDSKYCRHAHR